MKCKLFMTPMCPDCGEIKEFLENEGREFETVDATTDEGLAEAQKLGVMGVPTVVLLDSDKEAGRATSMDELKTMLENKKLSDF